MVPGHYQAPIDIDARLLVRCDSNRFATSFRSHLNCKTKNFLCAQRKRSRTSGCMFLMNNKLASIFVLIDLQTLRPRYSPIFCLSLKVLLVIKFAHTYFGLPANIDPSKFFLYNLQRRRGLKLLKVLFHILRKHRNAINLSIDSRDRDAHEGGYYQGREQRDPL